MGFILRVGFFAGHSKAFFVVPLSTRVYVHSARLVQSISVSPSLPDLYPFSSPCPIYIYISFARLVRSVSLLSSKCSLFDYTVLKASFGEAKARQDSLRAVAGRCAATATRYLGLLEAEQRRSDEVALASQAYIVEAQVCRTSSLSSL